MDFVQSSLFASGLQKIKASCRKLGVGDTQCPWFAVSDIRPVYFVVPHKNTPPPWGDVKL